MSDPAPTVVRLDSHAGRFDEPEDVVLQDDLPQLGLLAGEPGMVHHLYRTDPPAYLVFFIRSDASAMQRGEMSAIRWVAFENELMSRMEYLRPYILAMPCRDGQWWRTVELDTTSCPHCSAEIERPRMVSSYDQPDEQQRYVHPDGEPNSWTVLRECFWCGCQEFGEIVDDSTVRAWGEKLSGWVLEQFTAGYLE